MRILLLVIFTQCIYAATAQPDSTRVAHNFEFSLTIADNPPNGYKHAQPVVFSHVPVCKGGTAVELSATYSRTVRNWFMDVNLVYRYKHLVNYLVYTTEPETGATNLKSNLSFFNPSITFGRFFRPADSFRMSLFLGAGYNMLLSKKTKSFVIKDYQDHDYYDFYEGTITPFLNTPLTVSCGFGFYIPLQKNELSIKFTAATNSSTYVGIILDKIENYQPVNILEDIAGPSPYLFGASIGYRFNQFKPAL